MNPTEKPARVISGVDKIGGKTIYNAAQLLTALNQAGFTDAEVFRNDKGWICATAQKD